MQISHVCSLEVVDRAQMVASFAAIELAYKAHSCVTFYGTDHLLENSFVNNESLLIVFSNRLFIKTGKMPVNRSSKSPGAKSTRSSEREQFSWTKTTAT